MTVSLVSVAKARKMNPSSTPSQAAAHLPPSIAHEAPPLLPGLPDHLSMHCLSRVPASSLWAVSKSCRNLLYHCDHFQTLRIANGLPPLQWLYALVRSKEGSFSWVAYDPLACSWHNLPPIPGNVEFQLTSPSFIGVSHSVQCASAMTKLIMVAGSQRSKDEFPLARPQLEPALDCPLIFDTKKRQWRKGAPFRVPRKWCACGTAFDKLYVASGCGKEWDLGLSKSFEMYDPDKEKWCSLSNLNTSKFSGEAISAVNLDGNLYMVSGKGVFLKVGIIYSPTTGKWTEMPSGMRNGWTGSCVVVDGRFFVLEECAGRLKVYDPTEDRWQLFMEDEMLKNMEQLVGAPGKICGVVRAGQGDNCQDLIRIVDVSLSSRSVTDLLPPFGQVVALQVLSRMTSCNDIS